MEATWQEACTLEDFAGEEMMECAVNDQRVLLVRVDERVFTCPVMCPHMDEPLAHGMVDGAELTCTRHGWQWNLETGKAIGLAECDLPVAAARVEDGKVMVNLALLCSAKGECK
jgi:toluene monooxygenase system ferredoxin subunit